MGASGASQFSADLLRVEDLRVAFRLQGFAHEVVKGINLRVPAGKVVALVGESGSGKSVTAQAALGLLPSNGAIDGGAIRFADPASRVVTDLAAIPRDGPEMQAIRGNRISMIFQEPMTSLSPVHTIGDQVSEALTIHERVDAKTARLRTEAMLDSVGFPDPRRAFDMYAFELSGGLRQRAMIAMALMCDPALLIADEPTTALDVTIQAQVLGLLKRLQHERDMGLLLITHDLGVVANIADEVVVMYHGEIMEAGTVDDIFRRPSHPYLKALMGAVPHFDMKPGERLVSLREAVDSEQGMSEATTIARPKVGAEAQSLLELRDVTKTFRIKRGGNWLGGGGHGEIRAVDEVSLDVRRGECLGLVGESGCGKTTLSKLIMQALTPDHGAIVLHPQGNGEGGGSNGVDLTRLGERELRAARRRVQLVFQDPAGSLSPRMTVLNILREPLEIAGWGDRESQTARAVELMTTVGLDPRYLGRYPHSFSGGQRQRIGIARALALEPDLLILDEPVSALDVSVQAQILNLLNDLRAQRGLTYIFVSHNLAVVDYVADRIAVMARGRIVEVAPREVLFQNPCHPYTKSLLAAVPYPDLDRRLDTSVLEGRDVSDPVNWPEKFRFGHAADRKAGHGLDDEPEAVALIAERVGEGHHVLVREGAGASGLKGAA